MSVSPLPESRPILSQIPFVVLGCVVAGLVIEHFLVAALLEKELCVYDLTQALGMTQSAVSHQLRLLRNAHLVKTRREGKSIFYSLDDDHVVTIMSQGLAHIRHTGR